MVPEALWRYTIRYGTGLIALALLAGLPSSAAAQFSYSYLEVTADLSRTKNTADVPIEEDAAGWRFGVAGSVEVFESLYARGVWSQETKEFSNLVAHTRVDLDSRRTVTALGAGYHLELGARSSVYAEALAIVGFNVEHTIPLLEFPAPHGPLTVSTPTTTSTTAGSSECRSATISESRPSAGRGPNGPAR